MQLVADITVKMIFNLETGKKDIWIDYESDDDALPLEHEQDHRHIVEQLLGQGIIQADDVGDVVVRRGGVRTGHVDAEHEPVRPQTQKVGGSS